MCSKLLMLQNLFCTSCLMPRFDLGLVVQNYIQQGIMDFQFSVVFDKTQFAEFVHEKAHPRSGGADHRDNGDADCNGAAPKGFWGHRIPPFGSNDASRLYGACKSLGSSLRAFAITARHLRRAAQDHAAVSVLGFKWNSMRTETLLCITDSGSISHAVGFHCAAATATARHRLHE
jgi:hypothetical protein